MSSDVVGMNQRKRQIESYTERPPTDSLPLFLSCPRTLCYCDVLSSFLLLHSAVEAFGSSLIHSLPQYFHISKWTLDGVENSVEEEEE